MLKKFSTILPLLLVMLLFGSCSSKETMTKLNGEWTTTMKEYESGELMTVRMDLNLNADTEAGQWLLTLSTSEMPDMMKITIPIKKWSATDDELAVNVDSDKVDIAFSEGFKEVAKVSGVDLKALQKETSKQMIKELDSFMKSKIKEISEGQFTLIEGAQSTTFKRVK